MKYLIGYIAILLCGSVLAAPYCIIARGANGHIHRSAAAKSQFKRLHPCPANGHRSGACPGYVIDHIKPLCACGLDGPQNMQWQSIFWAKKKDVLERKMCN